MTRFMTRLARLTVALLTLGASFPEPALGQNASDKFELKPFWTVRDDYGIAGLSSELNRSGNMALQLSSKSGGQRNIWVAHRWGVPRKGTLSVWFYDTAPGLQTLYSGLYAFNSADPNMHFAVNVADWAGSHYVWNGPGVSETLTSVPRSAGWHEFKLQVTDIVFTALIDDVVVGSVSGDFVFDEVRLLLVGPAGRPNAQFFFDDFKLR